MTIGNLTRLDDRPIRSGRSEVRVFMLTWNDELRLESVLKHYRKLGVSRFFVADSGSTDRTRDLLAAASDVHAFAVDGEAGLETLHALLDNYGTGHWALTVDTDELFIYPHCEDIELPLFCRYLNHIGAQALACLSLDMYASGPVGDAVHQPGAHLLDTCRYFDPAPYRLAQIEQCPYFEIGGGVRERAFGAMPSQSSPVLTRVPLVQWQPGLRYLRGTANITPLKIADVLAVLLRFAFLSDCIARGENGMTLPAGPSTNLHNASSVRFEGSAQLTMLGLMRSSRAYEESVQLTAAARTVQSA